LLAVVVLPAFTAGGDKRLLRGAAERLDTHLKQAAARATGKPRGFAVWLDAGTGTAVFDLNFARMPTGTSLSGKVRPHFGGDARFAEIFGPPVAATDGSVVHFDMVPSEFRITKAPFITFPDGATQYNSAFPLSASPIDYVVYEPPSGPQITFRPTVLPQRVCVDLESSTIGVYKFGDYFSSGSPDQIKILPEDTNADGNLDPGEDKNDNGELDPGSGYDQFAICFDVYGKPDEAWGWSGSTATRIPLTPGKPIALLCTLAYQSGESPTLDANNDVDYDLVTESNPGAGWQNPDAFWVVIDPKTGRNLIVENSFEPGSLEDAQEFIVKDLLSQQ